MFRSLARNPENIKTKMSKSLKNFITISELLKKFNGEIIRLFLLQTHYRAPLNYKYEHLNESKTSLSRLYRAVEGFEVKGNPDEEILKCLKNDLNTPKAIARSHYLAENANKGSKEAGQLLKNSSKVLGLLENDTEGWFKGSLDENALKLVSQQLSVKQIEGFIKERIIAKQNKNYELADKIRDDLLNKGIVLEDKLEETNWRRS